MRIANGRFGWEEVEIANGRFGSWDVDGPISNGRLGTVMNEIIPLPQPLPSPIGPGDFGLGVGKTIEWQGKQLVIGRDVDENQPWYTYMDADGIQRTQPNFKYNLTSGPVTKPYFERPMIEVPSGTQLPINVGVVPLPALPHPGAGVISTPLPKETVKPYESLVVSPPSSNALYSEEEIGIVPAGTPVMEQKYPAWMWLAGGLAAFALLRRL
jgi:hypothetical protein